MIGLLLYNLYFSIFYMFLSIILISLHVQVAFWQLLINEHDDDDDNLAVETLSKIVSTIQRRKCEHILE